MRRKKRPCRLCRKWFLPNARAGARQRVCSGPECQRERHRRSCAEWHARNRDDEREERLRGRLLAEPDKPVVTPALDPMAQVHWGVARDAVGPEASVIVQVMGEVLTRWTRDAVRAQVAEITRQSPRHGRNRARDAMAVGDADP